MINALARRGRVLSAYLALAFATALVSAPAEAASLKTSIQAAISAVYIGTADLGEQEFNLPYATVIELKSGTGSMQADKIFADQRTLSASATEDLDLAGVLADPIGATLTCVKLKALYFRAATANTNDVLVGGATATQVTGLFSAVNDVIVVKPGGAFLWVAPQSGITIGAGSTDLLKVANSAGSTSVVYDIVAICTSA